jgi:hypothetical protein
MKVGTPAAAVEVIGLHSTRSYKWFDAELWTQSRAWERDLRFKHGPQGFRETFMARAYQ